MTDIYLHIVARMADYMASHPYCLAYFMVSFVNWMLRRYYCRRPPPLASNWATPKAWTEVNVPCYEGGENCDQKASAAAQAGVWLDPSIDGVPMAKRVLMM